MKLSPFPFIKVENQRIMAADFHIPNTPKFNSSEEVEIVKQIFSLKEETIFSKIGKKNSKNYK